jgi:hypothetical protein
MSLGRQISRGLKRFGKQIQTGTNTFGRQLSNTAKDIGRGLGEAQRITSGIERSFSKTPLAPIVNLGTGLVNTALGAGRGLSSAVQSTGTGIRQIGAGNFDQARDSFGDATNATTGAITAGSTLFV